MLTVGKNGILQLENDKERNYFLNKYEELDAAESEQEYADIFRELCQECCFKFDCTGIRCNDCPFQDEGIPCSLETLSKILRGEYKLKARD